ncbi:N-formylglutamate amidohydrolase [Thioclava sp. SK-1]|uniref:N-formylglutamate amidohydrolase n=1 Tax=Thioclava sp. SK-1 TaxID=1889770 RepID=UPI00082505EE|nr:N-formylglutamate amidohydrolase [Thioclava sp. SK-1]OCX65854.1 N-formylglutamate amidohydrolase [Thioclava sp. SK-1]
MTRLSPFAPSYTLHAPHDHSTAVLFASPHSGRDYPDSFQARSVLDLPRLRSSEDAYVDRFVQSAPDHGAMAITARYPRAYVDLNRDETELDPAVIDDVVPRAISGRIAAGLGVIPRVVSGGRAIYSGKITRAEAEDRLVNIWRPYHHEVRRQMERLHRRFGQAILVDMHSMPSEALEAFGAHKPDIVLGDRHGGAASARITQQLEQIFTQAGLSVRLNSPFAGAYIAQHYGRPMAGHHVVQVEINRALYLTEGVVAPGPNFDSFAALMDQAVAQIVDVGRRADQRLAAE